MKRPWTRNEKALSSVSRPRATPNLFLHHPTRHALRTFCAVPRASSWPAAPCYTQTWIFFTHTVGATSETGNDPIKPLPLRLFPQRMLPPQLWFSVENKAEYSIIPCIRSEVEEEKYSLEGIFCSCRLSMVWLFESRDIILKVYFVFKL